MTPDQALEALKTDMRDKMKIGNGYKVEPIIKYGVFAYNQVDANYNNICFCDTELEPHEHLGRDGHWWLRVLVYGYAPYYGLEQTEELRTLAQNFLHFLLNDYTYTNETEVISTIELIPGTEGKPVSMFNTEIRVLVEYDHTTLNT